MTGIVIFLGMVLVALGTLNLEFIQQAMDSASLVFVGLAIAVAAWLMYRRREYLLRRVLRDDDSIELIREYGNTKIVVFAGGVGLLIALAAQAIHSPFLGWLALLWMLATLSFAEYSIHGVKASLPILILLVFVKPIPSALDPWLQSLLQTASSNLTMMFLDFLKIFFYSEGNTIGLISQQSLASELFDGVHWLAPSVFLAIAWGIYFGYHWFRTVLTVCHAIFWVLVGNAFMDATLLANKEWGGTWIDSSTAVSVADYFAFALILFFMWSSDQFLASVFRPREAESVLEITDSGALLSMIKPHWKLAEVQWVLIAGLAVVSLFSLLASRHYGWGWISNPSRLASVQLPSNIEEWSIKEVENAKVPLLHESTSAVRSWDLEKDGKKLTLEIFAPSYLDLPYLWRWQWSGWQVDVDQPSAPAADKRTPWMLAQLARLPGEVCKLAELTADRYGELQTPKSGWDWWYQVPATAGKNLQRIVGINPSEMDNGAFRLPAGHTVSLSWKTVKRLDKEKSAEMISVWEKILPLVSQQLINQAPQ
jgi:hypothetical protein